MRAAALGLAAALSALPAALPGGAAEALDCTRIAFEGVEHDTCTVDLARDDLRLWLDLPGGARILSLGRLADHAAEAGQDLAFAMNAGMYHPDRAPVGHLVIDGREIRSVVTAAGPGNFGMLPNGVFCWGAGRARIVESRDYAAARPACRFATQSGPLLLAAGRLHPRFLPDSTSYRLRNGVGVRPGGREAVFAISRAPVTFHAFARLFRDRLGTPDALYLDGTISRMYAPALGRLDRGGRFGPILGVVVPDPDGAPQAD